MARIGIRKHLKPKKKTDVEAKQKETRDLYRHRDKPNLINEKCGIFKMIDILCGIIT